MVDTNGDSLADKLRRLEAELAEAHEAIASKDGELGDLRSRVDEAKAETERMQRDTTERMRLLEQQLESERVQSELAHLRALEKLRAEHQLAIQREKDAVDEERQRMSAWIKDVKDGCEKEKQHLEERISTLTKEKEARVPEGETATATPHAPTERSEDDPPRSPEREHAARPEGGDGDGGGDRTSTRESAGGSTTPPPSSTSTDAAPGSTEEPRTATIVETMTSFLKAQADAMAAHARATAAQQLPALPPYTGEGKHAADDGFERWVERFRERAKVAGWTPEHQLYQLKSHLDRTARDVFRMIPEPERDTLEKAIGALGKRFKPKDIEELRGIEFYHVMQGSDTIEQLGITVQRLGRRAFPSMNEKEFDRLIKGRFFQALLVKWQRKLEAPKPGETFHELYNRARMLEQYERQYAASAVAHSDQTSKKNDRARRTTPSTVPGEQARVTPATQGAEKKTQRGVFCWNCREAGHIKRDCPKKIEAPGRSNVANTGVVGAIPADSLTEEQLEQMLADRRLRREQSLLDSSVTSTVCAGEGTVPAVGPVLSLEVTIEGLPVRAMVDTGAQSTLISRATLRAIGRHLHQHGRPLPTLEKPTVKLYGKDGPGGGRQLTITAQVRLTFTVDGESVNVLVFVQPDSEQPCLLGMNALPSLGISVLRRNGEPVASTPNLCEPQVARVSLVDSIAIPSQKGRYLKVRVDCDAVLADDVLFEPCHGMLDSLGVCTHESLVHRSDDGTILVPVQNYQGVAVHLEAGAVLGGVRPLESDCNVLSLDEALCSPPIASDSCACPDSGSAAVRAVFPPPSRVAEILNALALPVTKLSRDQTSQLRSLVDEFSDVFALSDAELGCTGLIKHCIDTGSHPPIKQQPYRTPIIRRAVVSRMVDNMREQGIIKPSVSPWASPIVLVPKKDGTYRFCVDYRRLNAATKKDVYPLPRIDDILDTLGDANYFSSLDLASGYWQVELDSESRQKPAFTTYRGLYEFVRMPFGLCNAPATFQRLMQTVLAGLEWRTCFVYLDDILVVSRSFDEHLQHLNEVFVRLRQAGLRLKPRKCNLLRDEVPFLGHVISTKGVRPDPAKIEKVQCYPVPTDATQVRQFLGLASYYRRFMPAFAKISAPLRALITKHAIFQWTVECEKAFCELKRLLTTAPVLAYPRFGPDRSFILETDASGVGLGAVLSQLQDDGVVHPIAYASRSLDKHERNYGISELETLGLVWAVRYFRPYLLGHPCVVYTDHAACLSILNSARPSGKLARWALTIQEMDLVIKHKAGRENSNADALSRNPVDVSSVCAVSTEEEESLLPDLGDLQAEQKKDPYLAAMFLYLQNGTLPEDEKLIKQIVAESKQYDVIDGILHFENRAFPSRWCIVVPEQLCSDVLQEAHAGCFAAHFAEKKVYDRLRRSVWWRGMKADVRRHCRSCLVCASRKGTRKTFRPPLQPIPVGGPFHRVAVDILQLPLTSSGNRYVAVFMDYMTKWPEAFAIPDQKAETIAPLFLEHIVCRHGIPEELLSDRGTNFLSTLIQETCQVLGVKKLNTSGYHPQTDGLVEKFNATLINMIAKSTSAGSDWDTRLPYVLFAYRSALQESTKESPFFLLYGRDPRIPTSTVLTYERSPYAVDTDDYKSELMANLSQAWKAARDNIKVAQAKQQTQYDKKSRDVNLKVGDRVMVLMPMETTGARPFHGPFRVLAVTPTNAEVRLVDNPKAASIFVALDRVRLCFPEQGNETWTGKSKRKRRAVTRSADTGAHRVPSAPRDRTGPVTRSMARVAKN